MSHYSEIKIQMKDEECILEALMECGWTLDQIETHCTPTHLYGYKGDRRKDLANIIIRRKHVGGASNDIGFRLEEDGTYTAIISEYDQETGYGTAWLNKLKQSYGVKVVEKQARRRGFSVKKTVKQDGAVQLVLQKAK
jgi:hypothetical protein